jgi:hypothetical protein
MHTTKYDLQGRGLWDLFCELRGIQVWESADVLGVIDLSDDEATCLGLAPYPSTSSWDIEPIWGPSILESMYLHYMRLFGQFDYSVYCIPGELLR